MNDPPSTRTLAPERLPIAPSLSSPGPSSADPSFRSLAGLVLVLITLGVVLLHSLLGPLCLAIWYAALTGRLTRQAIPSAAVKSSTRSWLAPLLALLLTGPTVLLAMPIVHEFNRIMINTGPASQHTMLHSLVTAMGNQEGPKSNPPLLQGSLEHILHLAHELVFSAPALAWDQITAEPFLLVQFVLLLISTYYFSAQGTEMMTRIRQGLPLTSNHVHRLTRDYVEQTGTMLLFFLLTAGVQGVLATVVYTALELPHAPLLGLLTGLFAVLSTSGSAFVWVPLCGLLVVAGRLQGALVLALCGIALLGGIDILLRRSFSKVYSDSAHPLLILLGMLGGLCTWGVWGIYLGPLLLALCFMTYRLYAMELEAKRAARMKTTALVERK